MIGSNDIFSRPKTTPYNILASSVQIFANEWKTFMTISVERAVCLFGVSLFFLLLCAFIAMKDLVSVADAASGNGGHINRLLGDYDYDVDVTDDPSLKVGLVFLALCLFFVIFTSLINSAYQ